MMEEKESSYVYVLSNPAMPGYYKIGKANDPERRIRELFTTGVPLPFKIEALVKRESVDSAYELERIIHYLLLTFRVGRTEFFTCELDQIVSTIKKIKGIEFDILVSTPTDRIRVIKEELAVSLPLNDLRDVKKKIIKLNAELKRYYKICQDRIEELEHQQEVGEGLEE